MTPWDPSQYLKFSGQRLRPAVDLLNRIDVEDPAEVYDLGAGAGNVTQLLRTRWPNARITGIDESAEMLAKAAVAAPAITWERADLATWRPPRPADVIYSNAALHWLGDHDRVFPALLSGLKPGGALAVQLPRNFGAPSHTLITDAVRNGPWREKLEPLLRPNPVAEPSFYFDLLSSRTAALDIWEIEYLQVLQGVDPVKESPCLLVQCECISSRTASRSSPRRWRKTSFRSSGSSRASRTRSRSCPWRAATKRSPSVSGRSGKMPTLTSAAPTRTC